MTPESPGQMLEEFLGGSRHAAVPADGAVVFDLLESKYSISGEYSKCLLHCWCRGSGPRGRRSWSFAGDAVSARRLLAGRHALLTRHISAGRSSAISRTF
jgi:hypothetical protein